MKLAVIGSRDFNDFNLLEMEIQSLSFVPSKIISGGARGADTLGKEYSLKYNIELLEFIPDWNRYGKKAGMIRNSDIILESDFVLAFWDSKSKGTLDSINKSKKYNKEIKVIEYLKQKSIF